MSAAYLRILGHTREEVAEGAGVGERTLARWEISPWWAEAELEAERRWLNGLVAFSRRAVINAAKDGNADIGLKILERRIADLRPPKVHQVNEDLPELDYAHLTVDELDRLESGAVTRDEYYRLKVLTEQRARLAAEHGEQ